MNTTHTPESTRGLGSLKKVATRAVLAGGLSLAVLGLATGIANASVTLWCEQPTSVEPGGTGTVCVSFSYQTDHPCPAMNGGFDALIMYEVYDGVSSTPIGQRQGVGPITVTWPASWSKPNPPPFDPGLHTVYLGLKGSPDFQGCMVYANTAGPVDQGNHD